MKKHIIIAGVPRARKSTVSQMIVKRMGFQHIRMDSIIAG
ncbi:AAA family ATPase [Eisenbergiella tayi]|nr:AAA family ATPase [Eisenbergiella tayi]